MWKLLSRIFDGSRKARPSETTAAHRICGLICMFDGTSRVGDSGFSCSNPESKEDLKVAKKSSAKSKIESQVAFRAALCEKVLGSYSDIIQMKIQEKVTDSFWDEEDHSYLKYLIDEHEKVREAESNLWYASQVFEFGSIWASDPTPEQEELLKGV